MKITADMDACGAEAAEMREQIAILSSQVAVRCEAVAELKAKVARQKDTIETLQRMLFGRKSEKVLESGAQMLLPGMEEFLAGADDGKGAEKREHVEGHERRRPQGQPKAGWNGFPAGLPREELVAELPPEEREGLVPAGFETSERLVRRSEYVVQVVKRTKYVRPGDAAFGVIVAPVPSVPSCFAPDTDRCRYDVSVIAHVIAAKVVDHLPFYRQSEMFARRGIQFGRSAMCDYFSKASRALEPLYRRMAEQILACGILHADETSVRMLDAGGTRTSWIWARMTGLGPPLVAFHFATDRSKGTAESILGDYHGTIIRDGYAGYDGLPADVACCWAHCRRKFFEAQGNHPARASEALALIREL